MSPTLDRSLQSDPMRFGAGDTNFYRDERDNPTNAIDPTGLWTWKLGADGKVLVVSEKNDTLVKLSRNEGYNLIDVCLLGTKAGYAIDEKLPQGVQFDITSLIPFDAAQAIRDQQTTDYEEIRGRMEFHSPILPKVPKGRTIGSSGIDLAQTPLTDDKTGKQVRAKISDNILGLGQCHGFTALMVGLK